MVTREGRYTLERYLSQRPFSRPVVHHTWNIDSSLRSTNTLNWPPSHGPFFFHTRQLASFPPPIFSWLAVKINNEQMVIPRRISKWDFVCCFGLSSLLIWLAVCMLQVELIWKQWPKPLLTSVWWPFWCQHTILKADTTHGYCDGTALAKEDNVGV